MKNIREKINLILLDRVMQNTPHEKSIDLIMNLIKDFTLEIIDSYGSLENFNKKFSNEPEEKTIPITYVTLIRKLGWDKFCEITGTNIYARNEGFHFSDSDTFKIKESIIKKYNL